VADLGCFGKIVLQLLTIWLVFRPRCMIFRGAEVAVNHMDRQGRLDLATIRPVGRDVFHQRGRQR
jgi:hypothetical protein